MEFTTTDEIRRWAVSLRADLDHAFSPETAVPGTVGRTPSAGHCAAVALLVQRLTGADLISTHVDGESHWFNRVHARDGNVELDLTGDQFGFPAVQFSGVDGAIYGQVRRRTLSEANAETVARSLLLEHRLAANADA